MEDTYLTRLKLVHERLKFRIQETVALIGNGTEEKQVAIINLQKQNTLLEMSYKLCISETHLYMERCKNIPNDQIIEFTQIQMDGQEQKAILELLLKNYVNNEGESSNAKLPKLT